MTKEVSRLRVDLGERSYDIVIGNGLLSTLGKEMKKAGLSTRSRILLVSDRHVQTAGYVEQVQQSLVQSGYQVKLVIVPPGEETKNLHQAERLYDEAYSTGLDRRSAVVALGGGVVGDLAGFVAATYMRGIAFVQVPTTVLAHDSAVGGKVAVNHPRGKNIIGAFHQPKLVLYDVATLRTLPQREIRSGLAEVIKHGLIWDDAFFTWLEQHLAALLALEPALLTEMFTRACAVKAAVVARDEKEEGLRAILNYGHTLGHAIEELAGYGMYTHGEAVAIGMAFAAALSRRLGFLSQAEAERTVSCLEAAGLPTHIPASLAADELIALMRQDKKAIGQSLSFVVADAIGRVHLERDVNSSVVLEVMAERRGREP